MRRAFGSPLLCCALVLLCVCSSCLDKDKSTKSKTTALVSTIINPESLTIPDSMTLQEYVRWVRDPSHGHISEEVSGDYHCVIVYNPLVYSALASVSKDIWSQHMLDSLCKLKSPAINMVVEMVPQVRSTTQLTKDSKSSLGYEKLDPLLIAGRDTLHKTFIHMEYGLNGRKRYYVMYDKPESWAWQDFTHAHFVWNSPGVSLRGYFLKKILDSSPKIKYK